MKTIGIIGGLSWQSTVDYYRVINERENQLFNSSETGVVLVYSVNLEEMLAHVAKEEYDILGRKLGQAAQALESIGAEVIVLGTNSMHVVAEAIQSHIRAPLVHIADALGRRLKADGRKKVGLIGTPYTMELPFYREKLLADFGVEVIIPPKDKFDYIYSVIRNELTFNIIHDRSRQAFLDIFAEMHSRGAEGIVLGCTEIPLLVKQEHTPLPVYDTATIHALAAVEEAARD